MATKQNCHCCGGSGKEADLVKEGRALSGLRLRADISLRGMARRLKVSHTYLWQMENGKRRWPSHVVFAYRAHCNHKVPKE